MAKDFKLHIKNSQLAEAINLRGLKAKLSKKKHDDEGASDETEHKAQVHTENNADSVASQSHEEKINKKKSGSSSSRSNQSKKKTDDDTNNAVANVKETSAKKDIYQKEDILSAAIVQNQEVVHSKKEESVRHDEVQFEAPTFSTFEQEKRKNANRPAFSDATTTTTIEPSQKESMQHSTEQLKQQKEEKKDTFLKSAQTSGSKESSQRLPSPSAFLSASRNNPDQLGPVLNKKTVADKPFMTRSEPRQSNERSYDRTPGRNQGAGTDSFRRPFSSDGSMPRRPYNDQQSGDRPNSDRSNNINGNRSFNDRSPSERPFSQQSRYPSSRSEGFPRERRDGGSGSSHTSGNSASGASFERPYPSHNRSQFSSDRSSERRSAPPSSRYSDQRSFPSSSRSDSNASSGGQNYRSSSPPGGVQRHPGFRPLPQNGLGGNRRADSGFKPQPFVTRQSSDAGSGGSDRSSAAPTSKQGNWDRAIPAKEGLDERQVMRRQASVLSSQEEKKGKVRDTKEGKTALKKSDDKSFDSRLRHGFHADEDEGQGWRKKRPSKTNSRGLEQQESSRPTKIKIRLPISVKDFAQEMKLKASQLIAKFFLQGVVVTLNDSLDDETIVQLLGHEFGCEVTIDTSEQERLRLSERTIREEITQEPLEKLLHRPPIIAFMGHVDHGKTSLIDAIRKSNRASGEVGAITQHIGAFSSMTTLGPVTILDTPGHEAFSAMRERGAEVTDITILVVAGDEGMKAQTIEALQQAKEAGATIVVAINKCDKPSFDQEKVYRQLAENELLPESWGGQTITVNCSAVTGEGIQTLLEMISLQSEILELRANPQTRARGTVIESEMHKGLGPVATVLVQNGTLKVGDCLVFDVHWAKVKSMRDEMGKEMLSAAPSIPARINGLSGFPEAGEEFVVVKTEKEAREISEARQEGRRQLAFQVKKKFSLENMAEKASIQTKVLNLILRADVQGSLEALKTALLKIESKKVEVNIVSMGIGEISESDVQLANAAKATIVGFHTQIESHAEPMMKEYGVEARLHNIIYHAQDDIRELMKGLLDKIAQETDKGKAEVRATFKSSQLGVIAGCQVIDGTITRNCFIRVIRGGSAVWKGSVASLKRFKDDVREVTKGTECGILLNGYTDFNVGDVLEAYEITYLVQEL